MTQVELMKKLYQLVERDHGGCDQNTCDLSLALRFGYDAIAIERWAGCGASDDEFNELYEKLSPSFKYEYQQQLKEWDFERVTCLNCNAVLWLPEETGYQCDCCGKAIDRSVS
jgi:hypothetical protein